MSEKRRYAGHPESYSSGSNLFAMKPSAQSIWDDDEEALENAMHKGYVTMPSAEVPEAEDAFIYDDDLRWEVPLRSISARTGQGEKPHGRESLLKKKAAAAAPTGNRKAENIRKKAAPKRNVRQKKHKAANQEPRPQKRLYAYVGIVVVCLTGLSFIAMMMMVQTAGYFWKDFDNFAFINGELLRYDAKAAQSYKQYREYMSQNVIYPGIFVEGTHVGGMTVEEAKQALTATSANGQGVHSVTVAVGNKTWTVDSTNVPVIRDLGHIVERAYAIGRTNTTTILGTKQTPFRERTAAALDLRENHVNLTMTAQFDQTALQAIVDEIATYVTRPPKDADIQAFDFATRTFAFADEQVGVALDKEVLYNQISEALIKQERGITLTAAPVLEEPKVTKAQMEKDFKLIAAYTTDTTREANRNNNIQLASQAINGTVLMPGEVFSFNKTTGQRTIDKGYQEAGAIAGGQSIEEVGGGICQVSSTLYNAVVRANLAVVSRSPHAWPSTYVNRGEDATVNWPNLDFQFKNDTETPIFVITYLKDRKCSAEIWGMSLGDGITIDLKSEVTKTMEPPREVNYVNNPNLPFGTSKETVKARTGYVVDTYQVWYQNGKEFKREKLHTTTYKSYQQVVEYN